MFKHIALYSDAKHFGVVAGVSYQPPAAQNTHHPMYNVAGGAYSRWDT